MVQDRINILLVDDEARNLDTLESVLEDPSYNLLRAEDADKALRLLLENDVAAIVLDIKMPGVSGFELAAMIKGTKKFRQIPIVFLTAYMVDDKDIVTGYGAGAVDYLTKPINPAILRHKVAVFADLFRKTRALAELNDHLEARVQERTAELEKSEAALREANRQKDRFLATLAHELRNPLAPLRTGLDLLLAQPDRPAAMDKTLGAMNRQLAHMVRLIDDLLDVSRITRGALELRKERADLGALVERAVESAGPELSRRQQRVTVEKAPVAVECIVDPTRITQIIGNLLHNASKHSPPNATVRVRLRQEGDRGVIDVVDDGAGIPPDQIERVFDMFTKIARAVQHTNDGLGIGLALSRQLAELHGGTLSASSEGEGKGATFTLRVPLGIADSTTLAVAAPHGANGSAAVASAAAGPRGERLEVVLVEDNEDSAEMMTAWLEHLGHAVKVAHTGTEGVALILDARPDVVLCDVGLPEMDGIEVCKRVVSSLTEPPVMVALTGWGMESDRKRTGDAGFRHHLVKPVELEKLRDLLAQVGQRAKG